MDLDSVLKQMRTEYTPNDEDRRRVETALTATLLAAGTATGAAHLTASTGVGVKGALAKGSLELLPVWLKAALGVSATVATIGGGVYGVAEYRSHQAGTRAVVAQSAHASTIERNAAQTVTPRALPETVLPEAALPQAALPHAAERTALPSIAETSQEPSRTVAPTTPEPKTRVAAKQATTSIAHAQLTSLSELQLLGEASRALQEGRSEDAQRVLRDHERRYTQTALGQERTGLTLLARCADGDSSAKVEAAKFLQKTPNSPLAPRIKRECIK